MHSFVHRNISFATAAGLHDLLSYGAIIDVRESRVRELRNRVTILSRPRERCLFLPHRGNNIVASLAETIWMLAGRDDIDWLSAYLSRAKDFSDNGSTWRAAYGPRLRAWNGIDQLAETRRLLLEQESSRRAVMSLYDPDRDFVASKDIPCNNWLHWLVRDQQLHLTVGVRSNDLMWGFSGINSFEWSVLQEMMAFWVGAKIGDATYLASSFHLYAHHDERARKITDAFRGVSAYDFGLTAPPFQTPFHEFDRVLEAWFSLEAQIRLNPDVAYPIQRHIEDPFLAGALQLIRLHHGANGGWDPKRISEELAMLPATDLTAAAYELFGRKHPEILETPPHPDIASFFEAYTKTDGDVRTLIEPLEVLNMVKRLHTQKDAAYGQAWKKRGELVSILANIARKVDRLEHHRVSGSELHDESILDTAVDLFVYLVKYRLYLLERAPAAVSAVALPGMSPPFSDNVACFDVLADDYSQYTRVAPSVMTVTSAIEIEFEKLHALAANSNVSVIERLAKVSNLAAIAFSLVLTLAAKSPNSVRRQAMAG